MFTKFQAHQRTAVQGAGKRRVTTGDRVRSLLTAPADAAFEWYMAGRWRGPTAPRDGVAAHHLRSHQCSRTKKCATCCHYEYRYHGVTLDTTSFRV